MTSGCVLGRCGERRGPAVGVRVCVRVCEGVCVGMVRGGIVAKSEHCYRHSYLFLSSDHGSEGNVSFYLQNNDVMDNIQYIR